jgi:hypothetical protein
MRLYLLLFFHFLKTSYQLVAFVGIKLRNDMNMLGYFGRIYSIFYGNVQNYSGAIIKVNQESSQ